MTKRIVIALVLLMAMPAVLLAQQPQSKPWATLCNGVLRFTYGAKPTPPSQVTCTGCGKKIAWSTNYCSNCGAKNPKDFTVYNALEKILPYEGADHYDKPWYEKRKEIKKVVFDPSFKQVRNITSTSNWFQAEWYLQEIVGLENLYTANVTDMSEMFANCSSLKTIDLSHFNTSKVTNMKEIFFLCSELTSLDVSHLNTSNVTNMGSMFYGCKKLTSIDVSHFNTDKVTRMACMFNKCESLVSLDVSNFNTANVTDMNGMFSGCKKLKTLNLSNFNTSKVTSLDGMFSECKNLTSINLSSFNTSQVTGFACMFEKCESLTTLDISNFDTRKATYTAFMFQGCCQLKTVYVSSENWVGLKYYPDTYKPSLMGNEGTTLCRCNAQIIRK